MPERNDPRTGKWLTPHDIKFAPGVVVPPNEVAAIHQDPVSKQLHVILPAYKWEAKSYRLLTEDSAYAASLALALERHFIWMEEENDAYVFRANYNMTLQGLYEELEQGHYRFDMRESTEIRVYKDQGEELAALDRELWLPDLVSRYNMAKQEDEDEDTPQDIDMIEILKSSAGDVHGYRAEVNPYWKVGAWTATRAAGDGMDYSGVLETVHRLPGESDAAFEARAEQRANELENSI